MKVTLDSKKGLTTNLKVFISKKTINEKLETKINELKHKINIKGFRPGKAPTNLLKQQFGKAIYGEILDEVLKETSAKAIEEQKIKVAGQPKIEIKKFGEDKDLEYSIQIEELPKIETKSLEKIKLNDYSIEVSKEDVEKKLNEIAKNQQEFKDKKDNELSEKGDLIVFNYTATVNEKAFEGSEGKNTQIILGKDLFIKGFDQQLLGLKKEQQKVVEVTLPQNYPKKELAEKKAKFICKITNVKCPISTLVDEKFAKNLGAKDLNDLKEMIKKQIQAQYKNTLDSITKKEILEKIEKFSNFEIPKNLLEGEVSHMSKDLKEDEKEKNRKENEEIAKKRIKIGLILNAYGEQNKLQVSENELKEEIQKQVQSIPGQEKQIIEFYQKNPSAAENLRGGIYEDKIIQLIKTKSNLTKKTLNLKEADQIILGTDVKNAPKKTNVKKQQIVKKKIKSTTSSKKTK